MCADGQGRCAANHQLWVSSRVGVSGRSHELRDRLDCWSAMYMHTLTGQAYHLLKRPSRADIRSGSPPARGGTKADALRDDDYDGVISFESVDPRQREFRRGIPVEHARVQDAVWLAQARCRSWNLPHADIPVDGA